MLTATDCPVQGRVNYGMSSDGEKKRKKNFFLRRKANPSSEKVTKSVHVSGGLVRRMLRGGCVGHVDFEQ